MADPEKSVFSVDASEDPIVVRVDGRANYLTSGPINQFFTKVLNSGRRSFVVDFRNCRGMDSTFLGILAGVAIRIRKDFRDGHLDLCNLEGRNLDLVTNLGLQRVLTIRESQSTDARADEGRTETLHAENVSSEVMLDAHRNLVRAESKNAQEFEDVIKFLEKEVES